LESPGSAARVGEGDSRLLPPSRWRSLGGFVARLFDHVFVRWERARQRRDLASLNDRVLHDIGLSRADVEREASQSFWHVPR